MSTILWRTHSSGNRRALLDRAVGVEDQQVAEGGPQAESLGLQGGGLGLAA